MTENLQFINLMILESFERLFRIKVSVPSDDPRKVHGDITLMFQLRQVSSIILQQLHHKGFYYFTT